MALPAALRGAAGLSVPLRRPNVVFLLSDQHGHSYAGFSGHPVVRTPNLDRIAARGAVFRSAYCGSPVCTPSRASLATGMYPSDCESYCNATVWDGSMPCWGTAFAASGYRCFATGKMDLNPAFPTGFEEMDVSHGHARSPDVAALFRRPLCMRTDERGQVDGKSRREPSKDASQLNRTLAFIRAQAATQPWVAYCGLNLPHPRFVGRESDYERYLPQAHPAQVTVEQLEALHPVYQQLRNFKNIATAIPADRQRRARAAYYAMITEVDDFAGQIWRALEETGQLENTIFVYSSDHGESLGEHGLWFKNNLFDGAARVPLVIAGAGIPRGVSVDTPVAHVDLVRTLLEWAGAEAPKNLRGNSLTPLMAGRSGAHPGWAYTESHSEGNCTGSYSIRRGAWKYIHFVGYEDLLFNLEEDPGELINRIRDPACRTVREELKAILHSQVDPEGVSERAFVAQRRVLDGLARSFKPPELLAKFSGRLGEGQARSLLSAYYGQPLGPEISLPVKRG